MVRIKYSTNKTGHDAINEIYEEIIGFKYVVIMHDTTSDRATKVIAKMFNHDEDV